MPFAYKAQPWKGFYLLFVVGKVLVKLPFWIVTSALPWTRPKTSWTFKRTLMNNILRVVCYTQAKCVLKIKPFAGIMLTAALPN